MPLVNPNNKNDEAFNPNVDNSQVQVKSNGAGKVLTYLSFIFIIPIFLYIGKRNQLVKLQFKINEAASGIDVQLKKRKDTLVKLVDATKSSMKFEKSVLSDVTKMRTLKGSTADQLSKTDKVAGRINATFEAYPDLKSTKNIENLMQTATDVELEIAASRRLYNTYVNQFNQGIFTWPGSVIADGMNLSKLPLFAASAADKEDVSLKLQ